MTKEKNNALVALARMIQMYDLTYTFGVNCIIIECSSFDDDIRELVYNSGLHFKGQENGHLIIKEINGGK